MKSDYGGEGRGAAKAGAGMFEEPGGQGAGARE